MKKRKFKRTVRTIGAVVLALISSFCLCMPSFASFDTIESVNFNGVSLSNFYFQTYDQNGVNVTYDNNDYNHVSVSAYSGLVDYRYIVHVTIDNSDGFYKSSDITRLLTFNINKKNPDSTHVKCSFDMKVFKVNGGVISNFVETNDGQYSRFRVGMDQRSGSVSKLYPGIRYTLDGDWNGNDFLFVSFPFSVNYADHYGNYISEFDVMISNFTYVESGSSANYLDQDYSDGDYDNSGLHVNDQAEDQARDQMSDVLDDFSGYSDTVRDAPSSLIDSFLAIGSMFHKLYVDIPDIYNLVTYSFVIGSIGFVIAAGTSILSKFRNGGGKGGGSNGNS